MRGSKTGVDGTFETRGQIISVTRVGWVMLLKYSPDRTGFYTGSTKGLRKAGSLTHTTAPPPRGLDNCFGGDKTSAYGKPTPVFFVNQSC